MKAVRFMSLSVILLLLIYSLAGLYHIFAYWGWIRFDEMVFKGLSVNGLLIYNPLAIAGLSLVYGMKKGFVWLYSLVLALVFLPIVVMTYLFYPAEGIEIYLPIYFIISLIFLSVGTGLRWYMTKRSRA